MALSSKKPKALLILPPVYDFAFYDLFFKPYGLLRIGKWLKDCGWEPVFINSLDYNDPVSLERMKKPVRHRDGTGKIFRTKRPFPVKGIETGRSFARYGISGESLRQKITDSGRPDIILVSTFMTYWYPGVEETVKLCRGVWPSVPVFAGGVYATLMPDHCGRVAGVDHVVEGEGWGYLTQYLEKRGYPAGNADGTTCLMESCVWKDAAVLRLNTGCPMKCRYCASGILSPFSAGSPETLFEQFLFFRNSYGTSNFAFYDDALLFSKEKLFIPFLEKVIESGIKADFYVPNALHIDYLDSYTADLMARAGFREIRLGFESSDPDFHDRHGRKYRSESFPALAGMLAEKGFSGKAFTVYLLAGLPGQEATEVEESVRYLKQFDLRISVSEYSPVPGSALWEESVAKSRFPIAEEPLFHNNSLFPMAWERFTVSDMARIKKLSRQQCPETQF